MAAADPISIPSPSPEHEEKKASSPSGSPSKNDSAKPDRAARIRAARKKSQPIIMEEILDEDDAPPPADGSQALAVVKKGGLVKAAYEGRVFEVRHLLKEGGDPNSFELHNGTARLTPLMAAAAAGRIDIVAELLVAGADPDTISPMGLVASDLVDDNPAGAKIKKLLATFREEIEYQMAETVHRANSSSAMNGSNNSQSNGKSNSKPKATTEPGQPKILEERLSPAEEPAEEEGPSQASLNQAAASLARKEAIGRASKKGLALVEKALMGYCSIAAAELTADGDVQLAGEAALKGAEARDARKKRADAKEQNRLKKVAERAAVRRSGDEEEARMQRVAEKAAARRNRDPEEEERLRVERLQKKAIERRARLAEEEKKQQAKEEAKLKRLQEKQADRAVVRQMRQDLVEETLSKHRAESDARPVKRKVVEAETFICSNCGGSTSGSRCGKCGQAGMCTMCSKCRLCGTISGFATKVQKVLMPGMLGDN
mmetsp:Transcript_73518/g.161006  ORF Transcript_73518/g.161006 Transcript_73518/m.161006 type:complete len:488 (-) Transcript_73518:284-1747(-)